MNDTNNNFNKFTIPLRWGVVIGIVQIFIFTIYSMFLMSSARPWGAFGLMFVTFAVCMILLGVMGVQQRKAMGGFINFKQAFQGIFVSILIMIVISQVYSIIYTNFIDPEYYEKSKAMSIELASSFGNEKVTNEAIERAEEQIERQKSFSGQAMGFALSIIFYSIFGFIIAAIVKKDKPAHLD